MLALETLLEMSSLAEFGKLLIIRVAMDTDIFDNSGGKCGSRWWNLQRNAPRPVKLFLAGVK